MKKYISARHQLYSVDGVPIYDDDNFYIYLDRMGDKKMYFSTSDEAEEWIRENRDAIQCSSDTDAYNLMKSVRAAYVELSNIANHNRWLDDDQLDFSREELDMIDSTIDLLYEKLQYLTEG